MLSQLKRVSRRITSVVRDGVSSAILDGKIGGLMAAKVKKPVKAAAKSATKAKPKAAGKTAAKAAVKPAPKATSKTDSKAATKASPKAAATNPGKADAKSSAKTALKAATPVMEKTVKGAKAPVAAKAAPIKDAKAPSAKADKKGKGKGAERPADNQLSADDFVEAEEFAADIASDMEAMEQQATEEAPAPLTPSAALLAAMKPTISDERAAALEKKKKKDDLKLDRNGDLEAQWQTLKDKNKAIKPVNYKMSESFEARTPILHKVLGWGFIISNQNDRLEVLFQQGFKFLISNYKA